MKIRKGFVSNSSSASFVIQWQCHLIADDLNTEMANIKGENDLEKAIIILMDYCEEDVIRDVISKTKEMSGGNSRYITDFHTIMHNSCEDFGESAMIFNMAFTEEKIRRGLSRFEKIHETIEDGGW